MTGGTNFVLCQADWTSYFSTIAGAVADITVGSKCEHDVPRSDNDPLLLIGELEPDTPFTLTFEYENIPSSTPPTTPKKLFTQSTTNTCIEAGCVYALDPCVCSSRWSRRSTSTICS